MENPIAHPELLNEIRAFCMRRNMTLTRFGTEAMRDPNFVLDLMDGRECRRRTIEKVRAFMMASSHEAAE